MAFTLAAFAPQSRTVQVISTVETSVMLHLRPDLVRMALGLAVCCWIAVQLFIMPKDPLALRTWVYLGLVGVPFALVCAAALWWNYLNV